jgi:ABC-type transporter Mla subunit MlaD
VADGRPGLDLEALLNWPVAMLNEVAALPDTLRSARQLVGDLGRLADHLASVADQVEAQIQGLMGPMAKTVNQVDSIEASVTELRNTLFGILKRVPGARRTLVDLANPGERAELEQP